MTQRTPADILAESSATEKKLAPHQQLIRNFSRDLQQIWEDVKENDEMKSGPGIVSGVTSDKRENEGNEQEPGSRGDQGPARLPGPTTAHRLTLPSISVLDRVSLTWPVWLWFEASGENVALTLQGERPGTFIVQRSTQTNRKVISVRWPKDKCRPVVHDYPIRETQSGFALENSQLIFPDLCRLIAFYTASRDILDFKLVLPSVIQDASTMQQLESIAQMRTEFWCSPLHKDHEKRCSQISDSSIYVRMDPAGNLPIDNVDEDKDGKLCFVNPLFLQEQAACARDGTLRPQRNHDRQSAAQILPPEALTHAIQEEGSILRSRSGAGLFERPEPLARQRSKPVNRGGYADTLRRLSSSVSSLSSNAMSVSSGSWQADNRLSSSSSELESDLEVESVNSTSPSNLSNARGGRLKRLLPGIHNVIDAISSNLQMPERRVLRCIKELAASRKTYFGCLVQDYVNLVQNSFLDRMQPRGDGKELLKCVRLTMTQFKSYLIQCNEIEPPLETMISEHQIDDVVEKALYKCILKPLKGTLEQAMRATHTKKGISQRLQNNCFLARTQLPAELGVSSRVTVPEAATQARIKAKLSALSSYYSPEAKVDTLLKVCKMIYDGMGSSGEGGADDFFPVLTYSLLHCDCSQLAIQVDYMVELLNPNLMSGESGYYLTSVYAALLMLGSMQEEQATAQLRANTQQSLREWRRSRMNSSAQRSSRNQSSLLMVSFLKCGSMAKTFATAEKITAKEMCEICALHFEVSASEKQAYGLYAVIMNNLGQSKWYLLKDGECPHSVWAKITINNSICCQAQCYFVYKPHDDTNTQCQVSTQPLIQGPVTGDNHTAPKRDSGNGNNFPLESNEFPITNIENACNRTNTKDHHTHF